MTTCKLCIRARASCFGPDTQQYLLALQVVVQSSGETGELPKTFTFDNVFDWNCTQSEVYNETAKPIVDSVLEGYNGTVFAYGQTGTGKTHTMDGGAGDSERGIIPKTFTQIFEAIQAGHNLVVVSAASSAYICSSTDVSGPAHRKASIRVPKTCMSGQSHKTAA